MAGLPEHEMNRRVSLLFSWFLCLSLICGVCSPALSAPTSPLNGIPIQGTPFDGKLVRTGFFDVRADELALPHRSSLEELFAIARAFRYSRDRGGDYWQTPQETSQKRSGDCEDKAVWLYAQLKQNGIENVRLVIGKHKSMDRNYHVWVQVRDPDGSVLILDPAVQKRIWRSGDFSGGFYNALYSYDGKNRFKHTKQ